MPQDRYASVGDFIIQCLEHSDTKTALDKVYMAYEGGVKNPVPRRKFIQELQRMNHSVQGNSVLATVTP